jgi:hypothetical protein
MPRIGDHHGELIEPDDAIHLVRFLLEMTAIEEALSVMITAYFEPRYHHDVFEERFMRSMQATRKGDFVRRLASDGEYGDRSDRLKQVLDQWKKDLVPVRNAVAHTSPTISVRFEQSQQSVGPDDADFYIQHTYSVDGQDTDEYTLADFAELAKKASLIRQLLTVE